MSGFRYATIGDLVLILILLGFSAAFVIMTPNSYAGNRHVVVKVAGKSVPELPLESNTTRTVTGPRGETVIVIEDGKARIVESACPNHFCINMGAISIPGEIIVCVPNQVIVSIKGAAGQDTSFDGITQ